MPHAHPAQAGVPPFDAADAPALAADAPPTVAQLGSYTCTVTPLDWGFTIVIDGIDPAGSAPETPGLPLRAGDPAAPVLPNPAAAPLAAAFGEALEERISQLHLPDEGIGSSWPVTWTNLTAVLAALPAGEAAVVAAILAFLAPARP